MVVKEEQERVRALLADTITLLCRNGLTYKSEFNISALIGITLDKEDVLLVDIRETIKNNIEEENAAESSAESEEESPPSKRQRKRRKRKRSQNSNEEISLADKQFEPVNLKTELSEQDEDDIVFIKDEPGDSLDSSMDNSHHYKGQLQQQSFMSHYGNMSGTIAMPGTVNMSWDQSSQQQQQQQQNQSLLANASASNISTAAQISHAGGPAKRSYQTWSGSDSSYAAVTGASIRPSTLQSPTAQTPADLDYILSHALQFPDDKGYQCPKCNKHLISTTRLKQHYRENHEFSHQCPLCEKSFNRPEGLAGHLICTHRYASPFCCRLCPNALFSRNEALRRHVDAKHRGVGGQGEVRSLNRLEAPAAVSALIRAAMDNAAAAAAASAADDLAAIACASKMG